MRHRDGWRTASLEDVGIDPAPLTALITSILNSDPEDPHAPLIHSILIARRGRLVLEEYFYGSRSQDPHDMRSASKSFAPLLVGAARMRGGTIAPETPVYSLFGAAGGFANWDARKEQITVENLMTMTSGLACDDNVMSSPGNEDMMWSQTRQPDYYQFALDLPIATDPGGHNAVYCSAGMNLVGGVAQKASHEWAGDLFYEALAERMQFGSYYLNLTPSGDIYMGGGAYLRPRDELKLGQVYLSGGMWNGRRIVDADWIKRSITPRAAFARPVPGIEQGHDYGYGLHLHRIFVDGREYQEYGAEGNGGQMVVVVPELDLVVALNGGAYGRSADWYPWALRALSDRIIPAVAEVLKQE